MKKLDEIITSIYEGDGMSRPFGGEPIRKTYYVHVFEHWDRRARLTPAQISTFGRAKVAILDQTGVMLPHTTPTAWAEFVSSKIENTRSEFELSNGQIIAHRDYVCD